MSDYPFGDGKPECPHCKGRGVITIPNPLGRGPEKTRPCACVALRDVARNIERGWRGLMGAAPLKKTETPLSTIRDKNAWITADVEVLRSHLKVLASRSAPTWAFGVMSDADLMNAWLSKGVEVFDADVALSRQSGGYLPHNSLASLVEPPDLTVILLGVKAARNEAMPEVLLEALNSRLFLSKPTWVVDQPGHPLNVGHISHSSAVEATLKTFTRTTLTAVRAKPAQPVVVAPAPSLEVLDAPSLDFSEEPPWEVTETPEETPASVMPKPDLLHGATRSMLDYTPPKKDKKKKGGWK